MDGHNRKTFYRSNSIHSSINLKNWQSDVSMKPGFSSRISQTIVTSHQDSTRDDLPWLYHKNELSTKQIDMHLNRKKRFHLNADAMITGLQNGNLSLEINFIYV